MTFSFLWFVAGVAVGVNVTLAYAWLSLRHANRKAARPFPPINIDPDGQRLLGSRRANQ